MITPPAVRRRKAATAADAAARDAAARLEREHPGWVVWWGPYWRCFWAVSRWPEVPVLHAGTAEALAHAMRDATSAVGR